ncbi:AraC family transcriptional regulator [Actinomadura sp. 21ATH]|uniref:helix-turn-helix transcriptional regulator n=1 Tax=Actinomadura sp. 21ATH TaxID=1735444 RepID=UPI0035BF5268
MWTRVDGIGDSPLDLMAARIGRRHYAPHAHEEFAIGVCTGGTEVIDYRGERHRVGPGGVVMLEPGEPHTGGPADDGGFSYRVLYPPPGLFAGAALPHFREPVVADARLARDLWTAHRALSGPGTVEPLEGESMLLGLLGGLVRRHADRPLITGTRDGAADSAAARIARTVTERLADELTAPPTLAEMAADLGLSRYRLLRGFRQVMGMPPYAWLAQHRVARARPLLEAGHRPAEVAAMVGFADQAHLNRWFRRVLGITPGAYRNSVQDSVRLPRRH